MTTCLPFDLLARETGSDVSVRDPLHTELLNPGISNNKDLRLNRLSDTDPNNRFIQLHHELYGYAVATYGDYVIVGDPDPTRYDISMATTDYTLGTTQVETGSVDFYRYNKSVDKHILIGQLYNNPDALPILLCRESSSIVVRDPFHTEIGNTGSSADSDIEIDKNKYTASLEDGFGRSMDMYQKLLTVGCPYFTQTVRTSASLFILTGSCVDVFDMTLTETIPYTQSNAWIATLGNPDGDTVGTGSFGWSVSINREWLAVGSPEVSSSRGMVYLYRYFPTGSGYTWTLFQKIENPLSNPSDKFGYSVKLNKDTTLYPTASLIVGNGALYTNECYYYEFISGSWVKTFVFNPTTDIHPLTFGFMPYTTVMNISNGYGNAVSTYGHAAIVGAPFDRVVTEFSGSALYYQGAAYVYERCEDLPYTAWQLVLKTYGNSSIMKNNELGFSVDIFGGNAVAGIPRHITMSSCYVAQTVDQLHQCTFNQENDLNGQAMLLQKNTSSNDWGITNIYQTKKKFLSPYRTYGFDVEMGDKSMVVGAPIIITDDNQQLQINITQSGDAVLDDLAGRAYIYNLNNLRHQFHVGNVFYRNGKLVIMTSGSAFDGLFFNAASTNTYEYDLEFKGQHTVFEKQIICTVNPGEFNVSTNPSAVVLPTSSLDLNHNGVFDFQDLDVLLGYMQYKNTTFFGLPPSTDWSSSVVTADDEKSVLSYYQSTYDSSHTATLLSQSIYQFEYVNTAMQTTLDFNSDNRIDIRDMNILWKYFTNRLNQANYSQYITPACQRTLFSDVIDYLDSLSKKTTKPQIKSEFLDYERLVATDKTGSFLAPYATTVGLFAGLDLVAVAKLGSPIKITPELPINFAIKMDY